MITIVGRTGVGRYASPERHDAFGAKGNIERTETVLIICGKTDTGKIRFH